MVFLNPKQSIYLGLILRLSLIAYSSFQDFYFNLKYTDIDYSVYSDGARYVLQGGTPYDRHTYRYTPLVAYLMIGNIILFDSFGKLLFSLIDVVTIFLIRSLIDMNTQKPINEKTRSFLYNIWLLNPLAIQVSTRGNADTIVVLLIYVTLYFLIKKQNILAAIIFGIVVHFKIYPIIYALPIFFYIDHQKSNNLRQQNIFQFIYESVKSIFLPKRIQFALISGGIFIFLLVLFHWIYPDQFLYQTYIYHLIRKDNRHNFSPYFYFIYLFFDTMTPMQSVLAFIPQFLLLVMTGIGYYKDLPFCMLLQTLTFVSFNKVCTAQYFVWWMALLPLALINNDYALKKQKQFMLISLLWFTVEISWNYGAYQLEIEGQSAFQLIFFSCLLFFMTNIYLMQNLIKNHHPLVFGLKNKEKEKIM